jgi:hypothetical protein
MTSATDFHTAFLKVFEQKRKRFDDAQWQSNWTNTKDWSQLMIYDPEAVVRLVAPNLNLRCWVGEPFRLDAVFHIENAARSWFPMRVAIEHENDPLGFGDEIQKLLSVRCPLKVGITYALIGDGSQSDLQGGVEDEIRREFDEANALTREDGTTEYLFLLGCEVNRELQWRKLIFNAATGPKGHTFQ